ncbi:MAG: MMPL family transporter [Actinomycetes bacterium]
MADDRPGPPKSRSGHRTSLPGARVGGGGARAVDATRSLYGGFPLLRAAVAAATFVLLARAFRSMLLALKAVVLNLPSIGAAYGVLVLVCRRATGRRRSGASPPPVTSAALILFLAFASMASVPELDVRIMATALGAGILIDATILRALLVPALVALLGRWNWWLPPWAARLPRPAPSTPAPEPAGPGREPVYETFRAG